MGVTATPRTNGHQAIQPEVCFLRPFRLAGLRLGSVDAEALINSAYPGCESPGITKREQRWLEIVRLCSLSECVITPHNRIGESKSGKEKFEAQLAAIEALRQQPVEAVVAPLRAALKQRNNYLVAKAAELVAARRIGELLPELL